MTAQALRTALDPKGAWIPSVLEAADRRLSEVRRHVPDAGGLVIATDQVSARAYAKVLAQGVDSRSIDFRTIADQRASGRARRNSRVASVRSPWARRTSASRWARCSGTSSGTAA